MFPTSFAVTHYLAAPGGKPTPRQVIDWFEHSLQANYAEVVRQEPSVLDFTVPPGVWFESGELAWVRTGTIDASEGSQVVTVEADIEVTRLPGLVGLGAPVLGAMFPFAMIGTVVGGLVFGCYLVIGPYRASRLKFSAYFEATCGDIRASYGRGHLTSA